jgi:surface antigen
VRKTFHDGPVAGREAMARCEFARLERFAAALEAVPGAACPLPLELLTDPPGLRMQRAAGVDLFAFLQRHRLGAPLRERLATTMAAAIQAYVRALGEPCPDFKFDNVLFDPVDATLTFVDLGAPQDAVAPAAGLSPYEVTAGDLLGSVIFQSARPGRLHHRRQHAETAALAAALVHALQGNDGVQLRPAELARAAEAAYRRCAFGRSRRRSAWYATAGYALGRRVRTGSVTVGPPAPWRVAR